MSLDSGLQAWKQRSNHNRMIALEREGLRPGPGPVELAYFGGSAFRITSPGGLTIMVDPWRNHPSRRWDWFFDDFPLTAVDVGVSTHAHFDHDALHRLDAHVLIDRLIGTWEFGDVRITGIPDKHATDSSAAIYDFREIIRRFDGVDIMPPDNPRSWDHCLLLIETGGIRILAWGDNRHDPPERVWQALGDIDVVLLPADDSRHVMGFEHLAAIITRLKPRVVVPHHYYIVDVTQRQSTLQTVDGWLQLQGPAVRQLGEARCVYLRDELDAMSGTRVDCFGSHVAFDREAWLAGANRTGERE